MKHINVINVRSSSINRYNNQIFELTFGNPIVSCNICSVEQQARVLWLGQQHQHDIMVSCLPRSRGGGDVFNYDATPIVDLDTDYIYFYDYTQMFL